MGEDMVEREAIRVDWLDARAVRAAEDSMETDGRTSDWQSNDGVKKEDDDDDAMRRKRKRGVMDGGISENDADEDGQKAEEKMLELTLSLVVAKSVPPPQRQQSAKPSLLNADHHQHTYYHNGQINNNHRQQLHHQQQALGPTTVVAQGFSPVKQLLQGTSSPQENHSGSSRANLAASLKHLVSQQQPPKAKGSPRMLPAGGMSSPRHPLQYGASSPGSQFTRLQPQVPRSPFPHVFQQEGPDVGGAYHGMGRIPLSAQAPSQISPGSLGGHGPQSCGHLTPSHLTPFPKNFLQHSQQPRPSPVNRMYSRSPTPGAVLQHSLPIGDGVQPGQPGPQGQAAAPLALARIFPSATHIVSPGPNNASPGTQPQSSLHHQPCNAVTVASRRQTILPSPTGVTAIAKNVPPPAFSTLVRSSNSSNCAKDLINSEDMPAREAADENSVIVTVCDRKVKLTSELDSSSLYALCRRWVRNDIARRDQTTLRDSRPLPRPSPAELVKSKPKHVNTPAEEIIERQKLGSSIESISVEDLLRHHVEHCKRVRKRFRDDRMQRIARFMPRLALLLPQVNVPQVNLPQVNANNRRELPERLPQTDGVST